MNRSLSWIEASELNNRLNDLGRPVGDTASSSLPIPDPVEEEDLSTHAGPDTKDDERPGPATNASQGAQTKGAQTKGVQAQGAQAQKRGAQTRPEAPDRTSNAAQRSAPGGHRPNASAPAQHPLGQPRRQPVGHPGTDSVPQALNKAGPTTGRTGIGPTTGRTSADPATGRAGVAPSSNRPSAQRGGVNPSADKSSTRIPGEARRSPPPQTSTVPVPANQDPWTLTPAQPWTAVVGPSQDIGATPVPDLDYPATMALAQRLELFRDWIRHYSGEGAFFVSDAGGLPLLLERVRTSQAVTAVALERALHPLRGLLGSSRANSLCIELEDGRLVQTVWASTELGRIAVGMAPPRPLGPAATAQVRRALLGLFEGDEDLR